MTRITINVLGTPAPKGSSRAIMRGGRAINVPGGSDANRNAMRSWDANVRDQALLTVGDRGSPVFVDTPLTVELVFHMARPAGHWGKRGLKPSAPIAPAKKPDIDKLARCTLDSLTGLVFDDDARIVMLGITKVWAEPGREGAEISVYPYEMPARVSMDRLLALRTAPTDAA